MFLLLAGSSAPGAATAQTDRTVYLPNVAIRTRAPIFGSVFTQGTVARVAPLAEAANITWARYGDVLWSEIEPTPGARRWDRLAAVERDVQALTAHGTTPVLVIRSTPAWAQRFPGVACGAIAPKAYPAFAAFLSDLVARLGAPPYNVHYWELWNEPDVAPAQVAPTSGFGCWGDANDRYFGGGAFATMLANATPAIKRADPAAQVVFGGLLLDCDPAHPPAGRASVACASATFLKGALLNGAAQYFDILSLHSYAFWWPANVDWDIRQASWQHLGGATLGKLAYVRAAMAEAHVAKPVLLSEAGLLCEQSTELCQTTFLEAQANYVVRLYTRAWANGLLGALWFPFDGPGWKASGLLDAAQQPRPAYRALAFLSTTLAGASYVRHETNATVERYVFQKNLKTYEIVWTNNASTVQLDRPQTTIAVYDTLGQPVTFDGPLTASFEPLIIERK